MAKFKQGQVVQHILQREWVLVLFPKNTKSDFSHPQVTCRTKKLDLVDFYEFELEPASTSKKPLQQPFYKQ